MLSSLYKYVINLVNNASKDFKEKKISQPILFFSIKAQSAKNPEVYDSCNPHEACMQVTTLPMRGNQVTYVKYPAILLPSLCILLALRAVP
jgi:cobalamin biosynthesis Co2+ chelatase CbiK